MTARKTQTTVTGIAAAPDSGWPEPCWHCGEDGAYVEPRLGRSDLWQCTVCGGTLSAETTAWEAWGPVRGPCGHRHRTEDAAAQCADRDRRDVARLPSSPHGQPYSDRRPRPAR